MEEKILIRLSELYREQAHLTDKSRVWLQPTNSMGRGDLIKINYVLIRELEELLTPNQV
jgi:hypothetical protein